MTECTYCKTNFNKAARTKKRKEGYKIMERVIKSYKKHPTHSKDKLKRAQRTMAEMKKPAFINKLDKLTIDLCNQGFCNC